MRTHFFWGFGHLDYNSLQQQTKRERQHGIGRFKDMERIAHCSSRSENKRNNPHGMRLDSR